MQAKAAQDGKAGQIGPQYEQRVAEMQKQLDESSKLCVFPALELHA